MSYSADACRDTSRPEQSAGLSLRRSAKFRQTNRRTGENSSSPDLSKRSGKGWPAERRARQALNIRRLKPWLHSTGPRSQSGKAASAKNAFKHGMRSQAVRAELHAVRLALRRCRAVTDYLRASLRVTSPRVIRRRVPIKSRDRRR
jgi:hypothetical protein